MHLLILTKKRLIAIGICLIIGILAITIAITSTASVVQTVSNQREIPIYCVDTSKKQVALSFDAAWGNEQTDDLIKILDTYKVNATFFLVGMWVDKYPDSVKELAKHGNDIGNHSDTHPHLPQMSTSEISKQISSCNDKVKKLTGKSPTLFRPPYGDYNNDVVNATKALKMYCIQWDVDSLDWKDPTPEQINQRVLSKIKCGSIILMHNGAKNTPTALPKLIEDIKAKGFEIVPISKILLKGEYYTDVEGKMCAKLKEATTICCTTQPE